MQSRFHNESKQCARLIQRRITINTVEVNNRIFMPAPDLYHDVVCTALIKDGWKITDDPLVLTIGRRSVFVDLGAQKTSCKSHIMI